MIIYIHVCMFQDPWTFWKKFPRQAPGWNKIFFSHFPLLFPWGRALEGWSGANIILKIIPATQKHAMQTYTCKESSYQVFFLYKISFEFIPFYPMLNWDRWPHTKEGPSQNESLISIQFQESSMPKYMKKPFKDKRPPGLIAPLLKFCNLLGNPPINTTKGRDLIFNEGIRLLNMADNI